VGVYNNKNRTQDRTPGTKREFTADSFGIYTLVSPPPWVCSLPTHCPDFELCVLYIYIYIYIYMRERERERS
jgi:hypothetical protein